MSYDSTVVLDARRALELDSESPADLLGDSVIFGKVCPLGHQARHKSDLKWKRKLKRRNEFSEESLLLYVLVQPCLSPEGDDVGIWRLKCLAFFTFYPHILYKQAVYLAECLFHP